MQTQRIKVLFNFDPFVSTQWLYFVAFCVCLLFVISVLFHRLLCFVSCPCLVPLLSIDPDVLPNLTTLADEGLLVLQCLCQFTLVLFALCS